MLTYVSTQNQNSARVRLWQAVFIKLTNLNDTECRNDRTTAKGGYTLTYTKRNKPPTEVEGYS